MVMALLRFRSKSKFGKRRLQRCEQCWRQDCLAVVRRCEFLVLEIAQVWMLQAYIRFILVLQWFRCECSRHVLWLGQSRAGVAQQRNSSLAGVWLILGLMWSPVLSGAELDVLTSQL